MISSRSPDTPHQTLLLGEMGKGRASRPSLTLALPCALLGRGAWWAGGQTLSFVQVKPPLALDAEVLAEAALACSPTFYNTARATLGEGSYPGKGTSGPAGGGRALEQSQVLEHWGHNSVSPVKTGLLQDKTGLHSRRTPFLISTEACWGKGTCPRLNPWLYGFKAQDRHSHLS